MMELSINNPRDRIIPVTEVVCNGILKILHNTKTRRIVRGTTALTIIADLGPSEI